MIEIPTSRVEFTLGRLQITRSALGALQDSGEGIWSVIFRHLAGEWDELSDAEKKENEAALETGSPVTSRFTTARGVKLVVRTEAEPRSSTTVLLADEMP